ncbi:GNAT family N-acetyltransferase [Massilia horti]|uniref:N-acetyltransferase n=1 Tax=Massilia horti TaxID=2562153 RepID=A0A4Y9T618_9BURK|nr:GNAT family protein [Massilia horti]TFW34058.1 N-acetyltransferase [Massilia horti]
MISVQPTTLEFNGVRLEPLSLRHADGLRAAASDGELWNLRVTSVPEPHMVEQYIREALDTPNRMGFAVLDAATGAVMGSTSYHDIVPAIGRVEIGFTWYAKSRQRSHVNTSCKLMLMSHAFDTLGCELVGLRTDNLNLASQAAIERLGAQKDGILRHHHPRRDGTVRDTVMYSIMRSEWPEVKSRLHDKLNKYARP